MLLGLGFGMRLLDESEGGGGFNQMLLQLCFCMTLHDARRGGVLIKCCWPFAFVCCNTAEGGGGGGFNQMLLLLWFCMTLHDESGGEGFKQMLLGLCFCMTLHDERMGWG